MEKEKTKQIGNWKTISQTPDQIEESMRYIGSKDGEPVEYTKEEFFKKFKYYFQASDGLIGHTEKEYEELVAASKQWERMFKKAYERSKDKGYTFKTLPKEFFSVVDIDLVMEDWRQAIITEDPNLDNFDVWITIIDMLINEAKPDLHDPLKKDRRDLTEYQISKLEREKAFLESGQKIKAIQKSKELPLPKISEEKEGREGEKKQTLPAKYFALYHWVLIDMGKESLFEKNENDQWVKSKIEAFAQNRYVSDSKRNIILESTQVFYREFKDLDLTKKEAIARSFGADYKEKLIQISGNDADVIHHLESYPN